MTLRCNDTGVLPDIDLLLSSCVEILLMSAGFHILPVEVELFSQFNECVKYVNERFTCLYVLTKIMWPEHTLVNVLGVG